MTAITSELARRGLGVSFSSLPDDIVNLTALSFLDYVGVALAGASEPAVRIVREQAIEEGIGSCSIFGSVARLSASQAALVNGVAGHALDYDDVHMSLPGHVSVAILPGILALAESRDIPPKDVIASFVAGFETACRIALLVSPGHYSRGFHATATVGSYASALACSHILKLDERRTVHALGIAGAQAAGLKAQFGTMCKPFHAGRAAQNGALAALLAERGFESCPDVLGESQGFADAMSADFNPEAALTNPEGGFHLRNNLFKFHASCYGTHGLIEAVRKLREHKTARAARLVSLTARVGSINDKMCNIHSPLNSTEAKFSLRLMGAFAWYGIDTAGLGAFEQANIINEGVKQVCERIEIVPDPALSMTQTFVIARFDDGSSNTADHDASVPERDFGKLTQRLRQKFLSLVSPIQGDTAALATTHEIENFGSSLHVGPLMKRLCREGF